MDSKIEEIVLEILNHYRGEIKTIADFHREYQKLNDSMEEVAYSPGLIDEFSMRCFALGARYMELTIAEQIAIGKAVFGIR